MTLPYGRQVRLYKQNSNLSFQCASIYEVQRIAIRFFTAPNFLRLLVLQGGNCCECERKGEIHSLFSRKMNEFDKLLDLRKTICYSYYD